MVVSMVAIIAQCNAMGSTANSGTFILNGVVIRNNQGRGVWVPNEAVVNYMINGCYFYENNVQFELNDNTHSFTSNLCFPSPC